MVIKLCVFQALLASVAGDEVAGRFDGKFIFIVVRMGNLYDDVVFFKLPYYRGARVGGY